MPSCRVALFFCSPLRPASLAIALGSWCTLTHCAVEIDGTWYDASETRGNFDKLNVSRYRSRRCLVIELKGTPVGLLNQLEGKGYDWQGIRGWMLSRLLRRNLNQNEVPYCFEAGFLAMKGYWSTKPVSGCDLIEMAEHWRMPIKLGLFGVTV